MNIEEFEEIFKKKLIRAGRYFVVQDDKFPTLFIDLDQETYTDFKNGKSGELYELKYEEPLIYTKEQMRMLKLNSEAAKFFHNNIHSVMEYCKKRELNSKDIETFYLGGTGKGLYRYLKEHGFIRKEMIDAGLFKEKDGKLKDTFWNRLIFPIRDKVGNIIAFGGRSINKDDLCKYINTAETEVFSKRNNLFMYDVAHNAPCKAYILCEGYMDVLTMHKNGFINTVASLGTSLTREQAHMLQDKNKVYIMYDSDAAGIKAAKRAVSMFNTEVKIVSLSPAKDPDEFLVKFGRSAMLERLKCSQDGRTFLLEHYEKGDEELIEKILSA